MIVRDNLVGQQGISGIDERFVKRCHTRTRTCFNSKTLRDCITSENSIFDRFFHHMDVRSELGFRSSAHRLPNRALFFREGLERHFIKSAAGDRSHNSHRFIFGHHQRTRCWLQNLNVDSRNPRDVGSRQDRTGGKLAITMIARQQQDSSNRYDDSRNRHPSRNKF